MRNLIKDTVRDMKVKYFIPFEFLRKDTVYMSIN